MLDLDVGGDRDSTVLKKGSQLQMIHGPVQHQLRLIEHRTALSVAPESIVLGERELYDKG